MIEDKNMAYADIDTRNARFRFRYHYEPGFKEKMRAKSNEYRKERYKKDEEYRKKRRLINKISNLKKSLRMHLDRVSEIEEKLRELMK